VTNRNPQSGVTLLETMVALMVMAMVAMLLSSALGGTARSFGRSTAVTQAIDQAFARRELRIWLEEALLSSPPGDTRPIFVGTASGVTFLSQPRADTFWPGAAAKISLFAPPSFTATGITAKNGPERSTTMDLAPAGTRLAFGYWGQTTAQAAPAWHDDWPPDVGLPGLVRIDFIGGPRPLPPLIVRPGKTWLQSEMSLSSLVPPALPSRP
jgi:prepilin-type N-terminal cleavage/methylation domain-containing protein